MAEWTIEFRLRSVEDDDALRQIIEALRSAGVGPVREVKPTVLGPILTFDLGAGPLVQKLLNARGVSHTRWEVVKWSADDLASAEFVLLSAPMTARSPGEVGVEDEAIISWGCRECRVPIRFNGPIRMNIMNVAELPRRPLLATILGKLLVRDDLRAALERAGCKGGVFLPTEWTMDVDEKYWWLQGETSMPAVHPSCRLAQEILCSLCRRSGWSWQIGLADYLEYSEGDQFPTNDIVETFEHIHRPIDKFAGGTVPTTPLILLSQKARRVVSDLTRSKHVMLVPVGRVAGGSVCR